MDLITRTLLLLLVSCIVITLQNAQNKDENEQNKKALNSPEKNLYRDKRAIYFRKRKVGPIRQIFGLIFDQWNETRSTYKVISKMLDDNFLPDNAPSTTTTTPSPNLNVSTKAPPFRITRAELFKILRRNLKGINRLYNLELQDALKQSRITEREFRKNVSREIGKFL